MARRRSHRIGRERGVRIYIPAEELEAAGVDVNGPAPFYRTWGFRRGSVIVRLYREG
jgi:hypothetical protein